MEIKRNSSFHESMMGEARKRLATYAKELRDHVTAKLKRPRRGSIGDFRDALGAGEPPHTGMTGNLSKSISWQFSGPDTIQVGTHLRYGLWLEMGVPQILPRSGKFLAIPLTREAIRHRTMGGSARTFPRKLVRIPSRGRSGVYFLVQFVGGKNARGMIHYVLVGKVTIPPHPFLRPSVDETRGRCAEIFGGGG